MIKKDSFLLVSYIAMILYCVYYEPKYTKEVIWDKVDAIKNNTLMPVDVYDSAAWQAVSVLSAISVAQSGAPQAMPWFYQRFMNAQTAFGRL